jgi:transcriptional regulator with XRE-family HTH domain
MHINVETFDALLRKSGMTLAELSRKSKVGTKTIGRIRKFEDLRKSNVEKIANVFGVDVPTLISSPSDELLEKAGKKSGNMQRMVIDLQPAALNRIWMTAHYYNISVRALLEFAPLLFSIAAETSLNKRKKKIEGLKYSFEELLKDAPSQHKSEIDEVKSQMNDLYWAEMESIESRDLTGGVKGNYYTETSNGDIESVDEHPFFNAVEEMALSANFNVEFFGSFMEDISYYIDKDGPLDAVLPEDYEINYFQDARPEIGWDNEHWSSLNQGDIIIRDMPSELMAKDKVKERILWVTQAYNVHYEAAMKNYALQKKESSNA